MPLTPMKFGQFEKALNLMKKTGMGMVIMDESFDRAYVLMNIDDFQSELNVSHDIGVVDASSGQDQEEEGGKKAGSPDIWDVMPEAGSGAQTWDPEGLTHEEMGDLERQYEVFAAKNVGEAMKEAVPETSHNPPTTPVSDAHEFKSTEQKTDPKENDFGEEEFYLEPVD